MEPDCPYETSVHIYENMHYRIKDDKNLSVPKYEGWNFNSGNYLFTTDTK